METNPSNKQLAPEAPAADVWAIRRHQLVVATTGALAALCINPWGSTSDGYPNPERHKNSEAGQSARPHDAQQPPADTQSNPVASATKEDTPEFAKKDSPDCTWITEKPSGHYFGYACKGDGFVKLHNSHSGEYDYGVITVDGRQLCGWVEAGIIRRKTRKLRYQTCMENFKDRENRYTIGEKFNCRERRGESTCVDGKTTELSEDCDGMFWRNFASSKQSPSNLKPNDNSGFYNYVGKEDGPVRYRLTRRHGSREDGKAVVVRSAQYGWGVMEDDCIDRIPRGGPKKYSDTVAGEDPNSERP